MINTRSIQFRLIVWYSCLVIAIVLAFGFYTYHGLREELYAGMEHTLNRRARQIGMGFLAQDTDPAILANHIHSVYSPESSNRFIRILNADRSIRYVSGAPQDGRFNPSDIPLPEGRASSRIETLSFGNDMLVTASDADVSGSHYLIEMGAPTNEMEQTLHGLLITLFYGLPVITLIVSGGGYMLIKRALQPVEDIRSTAERITFGNLSNRLPVAMTGDALEHLSVTLNQMIDRLEDVYEQASRFSADASHELRTPLTILRGELEALAAAKEIPANWRERMGSMLEETERLSLITSNLFTISRLDAGGAGMVYKPCNLTQLVQTTADQMALLAEDKHIAVHMDGADAIWVNGDMARFKQVVVNLLDNAIKYTPSSGNIWVKIMAAPHKAVLEIRDDGMGIAAASLPHVFERFYRTDKARSREMGGAGLGLSIVRSIVQAHGGSVDIKSAEGRGTTCRIELPLAEHGEAQA